MAGYKKNIPRRAAIEKVAGIIGLTGKPKKKQLIRDYLREDAEYKLLFHKMTDSGINKLIDIPKLLGLTADNTDEIETAIDAKTPPTKKKSEVKPFVLSAWNQGTGTMMSIDTYCDFYSLPRSDVRSYKLVSHTGTPFYNILFKENVEALIEIDYTFLEELVKTHIAPVNFSRNTQPETKTFDRLVFTDTHIGMDTNADGFAMYATKWGKKEIMNRLGLMLNHILENKKSSVLYIDELGDYLDGWDAQTTRGGHALPQNMDNQKAFDVAVRFKVELVDELSKHYDKVIMNNICEDNHAGAFGYVVNSAVKHICEIKHDNVEIINHRSFMNHYFVGKHCFVITHGKDSKNLKFGFKPTLDTKQIEKIDGYLKHNGIYRAAEYIEFSKGDSHQYIFDYTTSQDFDYMSYPAFSPSSEWVQTNFKKGRSGFVFSSIDYEDNAKTVSTYFFK